MQSRLVTALAAASSLALWASAARANVTYFLDPDVQTNGNLTITGSITTDGKLGPLTQDDIVSWDIVVKATGALAYDYVLTPSSSFIYPGDQSYISLTATTTGLFWDFGDPSGGTLSFQAGYTGSAEDVTFSNDGGIGVYRVDDPYSATGFTMVLFGVMEIASRTPEPATWALMLAGFAGLGAALRSRRGQLAA